MSVWLCRCGMLVKDKRFCPRCKWVRFDIRQQSLLTYSGSHVGHLEGGLPFLFPPDLLSNHVMVVGQTGTGKTRFAQSMIAEIQRHPSAQPVRFLIVDIEGTYSRLVPYLKGKTEYYDINSLRINPFDLRDPALIRELFRESVFKDIQEEFVDLSAQMQFVLQEAIAESGNMMELIHNIKNYSRHRLTAIEKTKTALMVRLDPFLRSPLKEIFMCEKSNPDFSKLGDCHTIIDLHALDALVAYNSELRLIYNTITTYFLRKMLAREETDVLSNVFVADEAQLLVPKILQKVIVTQSHPATQFATRLRKRGCGLLLITQSPSNLEVDIFKNSATKIVFRLQSQEDIKMIADAAGFVDMAEYEHLSNEIVRLPRKQAVVFAPDSEPFLITSKEFDPPAVVLSSAPAPVHNYNTVETSESHDEEAFMKNIREHPFLSVSERRSTLGWNHRRFSLTVDSLLKKKAIEEQKVAIGSGSPRILYQTKGQVPSVRHQFILQWVIDRLKEKGYTRFKVNAEGPDLEVLEADTCIEIELGKSNMYLNAMQDVHKFGRVIVMSDDKRVLQALSAKIKDNRVLVLPVQQVPACFEEKRA